MYQGKRMKKSKKTMTLLASLVLVLGIVVAGTVAFLVTNTNPVVNTFTPSRVPNKVVETFDGNVKSDVKIKNEGDISAYIRVAVIANWVKKNEQGGYDVYGEQPVLGRDYTISPETIGNGWVKSGDYYYYTQSVPKGETTAVLFDSIAPVEGKTPAGYSLSIEILSQTIQADGVDANGEKPVVLAWGVDPTDL